MAAMCTLQERLVHWRSKTVLGDRIAMFVFFFGGLFLLWYELSHVASFYHSEWTPSYILHLVLGIFFAVNIYGNWGLLFLTDVTGKDLVFPSGPPPPGWTYCHPCGRNEPVRSHHCPLCKVCVLKHDHHCWFAGTCVGHNNHRYFVALSVHTVLAGLYCNIYNWAFVWNIKGDITMLNLLSFVIPHVTAAMGQETWYSFYITTLSMVGFMLTVLFVWLLQIQIVQIIKGQTKYERKKGICEYDLGLRGNTQAVLGHQMFLTMLCPFIKSSVDTDGTHFYSQGVKSL